MAETIAKRSSSKALFNKESRQRERLDAIVRTAARLIYEHGVAGTSLDDVADALGIAKASLYYYVKGKDDLVYLCNKRIMELKDAAIDAADEAGATGAEKLRLFLAALMRIIMDPESGMPRLWQSGAVPTGKERDQLEGFNDAHSRRIQQWVREGMQDGSIATVDPTVVETALLGAVYWIPMSRKFAADAVQDLTDQYLKLLFDGVTGHPRPKAGAKRD